MISRYTSFATVVLVSLIFAACGLKDPEWAGSWEVTRANGEQIENGAVYYDLSEEAVIQIYRGSDGEDCSILTYNITEIDGNVVTITTGKSKSRYERIRYEVSGETLKETSPADSSDHNLIAKAVDGDPRYLAGCE